MAAVVVTRLPRQVLAGPSYHVRRRTTWEERNHLMLAKARGTAGNTRGPSRRETAHRDLVALARSMRLQVPGMVL